AFEGETVYVRSNTRITCYRGIRYRIPAQCLGNLHFLSLPPGRRTALDRGAVRQVRRVGRISLCRARHASVRAAFHSGGGHGQVRHYHPFLTGIWVLPVFLALVQLVVRLPRRFESAAARTHPPIAGNA